MTEFDLDIPFHYSQIFQEGNFDKIKEEYEKQPEKFSHGCYYTILQICNRECMDFLLSKKIPIPYPINFYEYVSDSGDLDFLKWIHEEKKIPLNPGAYWGAATYGWFDVLEYLVQNKCPYDNRIANLMENGCGGEVEEHQKCWKYFKENVLDKEDILNQDIIDTKYEDDEDDDYDDNNISCDSNTNNEFMPTQKYTLTHLFNDTRFNTKDSKWELNNLNTYDKKNNDEDAFDEYPDFGSHDY